MGSEALQYAVRPRVVGRHLGELLVPLGLALVVPAAAAATAGSWGPAGLHGGLAAVVGAGGWRLSRIRAPADVQVNEGMVVVALAFLLAALAFATLFSSHGLAPVDAFFEAVSSITTTGLSVVSDPARMPPEFVFSRAWGQWFGGLGFVTVSALLVTRRGRAAQRLQEDHAPARGAAAPDPVGGTRAMGRRALMAYGVLSAGGLALLLVGGASPFDAGVHALSAVSTGGFSTTGESIAALTPLARGGVTLLTFLSALPLLLLHRTARGEWSALRRAPQLPVFLGLALGGAALLVVLADLPGTAWWQQAGHALVMTFSAQTTSGFSSLDVAGLAAGPQAVLMTSMLLGGCYGSSAGGVKVWRAMVAGILLRHSLLSTALPEHAVRSPRLGGEAITDEESGQALGLILLFLGMVIVSWYAFLVAGHDPMASLFDVVSATGTVGLSAGVAGPELASPLKFLLCANMLLGRLEIIAVLVLISPATWLARRRSGS